MAARPEGRNRFLVLMSDGDATTCHDGYPALSLYDARHDHGIETFAVGVAAIGSLYGYAEAGGRPGVYNAGSLDSLRAMLQEIEDTLSGCVFDVPLATTDETRVSVRVAGIEVPFDPARRAGWGWSGIARGSVSLFGRTCEQRREAHASVEIVAYCDPPDGG
jgi:hypothetical protein